MRAGTASSDLPQPRRAFTLIEILVIMILLGILLGVLMMTLVGILRVEKGTRGVLDRLTSDALLADQFRDDVAQAAEAPQQWQTYMASSSCLILRMTGSRHVIYRWDKDELLRSEFSDFGKPAIRPLLPTDRGTVAFSRTGPGERLLVLRLVEARQRPGKESVIEISAALGGDRR